ncbi:hypothetical protein QE152_g40692 [Popillia japonica]|uniref:Uncharacterized protein n=1 Tax=Popillia japonica TaxID=7064 RepID=A0AAW1HFT4_POPJA
MAMIMDKKIGKESKKIKVNNMRNNGRIRIATWNVRSTYSEGALKHLAHEMDRYNVHLLAIQETKLSFAAEFGLIVVSTKFQHKEIHKGTWLAPNKKYVNQIDHVLIQKQHTKKVIDVRSYQGADADTEQENIHSRWKQIVDAMTEAAEQYHSGNYRGIALLDTVYKIVAKIIETRLRTEQENIHSRWKQIVDAMTEAAEQYHSGNYRGIALLDTVYKIVAKIIETRLREHAEGVTREYQCGALLDTVYKIVAKIIETRLREHAEGVTGEYQCVLC